MAPVGDEPQATARELAAELAAALTPELWAQIRADHQGRRAAAAQRYAAGRAAMSQRLYRDAALEFEAALMGESDNPDYLSWAAQADVAQGDFEGALVRLWLLAHEHPADVEVQVRLGDAALLAGKPQEAEAAFRTAEQLRADDLRAIEGVARAARARGDFSRSETYYDKLLALLIPPSVHWTGADEAGPIISDASRTGPCASFQTTLAHLTDDSLRLAETPPEELPFQLARICLRAERLSPAVATFAEYHRSAERRPYTDAEYLELSPALDRESEDIARRAQSIFAARALGQLNDELTADQMEDLHARSERLATLAEKMQVSLALDPAHRYRVLAYNLLNQSNFESLMYLRTGDADRQRRAELLRDASRKSRVQARELGESLLGATGAR
jgi:hypothetical protein